MELNSLTRWQQKQTEDLLLDNGRNQSDADNVHILRAGKQMKGEINPSKNKSSLAKDQNCQVIKVGRISLLFFCVLPSFPAFPVRLPVPQCVSGGIYDIPLTLASC